MRIFSGKTARAIQQDFYAKIFLMTLYSAYAKPIEEKVRQEFIVDDDHKHPQKINRTNALANLYKEKNSQSVESIGRYSISNKGNGKKRQEF